ncbi:LuxR C-terminal-related transcriptional regulator [Kitasatospora sp. NPDC001547]|uniref:LuxR C-terminal-related transcriptional regulator n=1 Tax=Kitasatospora sp. NPDC001547 TaxID=3364015 RepID=UPI00368D47F2|nr:response regulator transcription factor [Kitasatospora sp. Xyl93]
MDGTSGTSGAGGSAGGDPDHSADGGTDHRTDGGADKTWRQHWGRPEDALARVAEVLRTPRPDLLRQLSAVLDTLVPHTALAQLSGVCTFSPSLGYGPPELTGAIGALDLSRLAERAAGTTAAGRPWQGEAELAGRSWPVVVTATSPGNGHGAVLVLVRADTGPVASGALAVLHQLWDLVIAHSDHRATDAAPAQTATSRASANARARAIAEFTGTHSAALAAILAPLRSADLDDATARRSATELAVTALLELRQGAELDRALSEKPAAEAFARMVRELRPLLRHTRVQLDVAPPAEADRSLPADAAHTARDAVRAAVLLMLEQEKPTRLHVSWQFTADGLLRAVVRGDGLGLLTAEALTVHRTADRIAALGGRHGVEAVPGWGTTVTVDLPLALPEPVPATAADPLDGLHPREREVLDQLARGRRNRDIAAALHISESTVKFHVANILAKLDVASRGEAAALAHRAGLPHGPVGLHAAS